MARKRRHAGTEEAPLCGEWIWSDVVDNGKVDCVLCRLQRAFWAGRSIAELTITFGFAPDMVEAVLRDCARRRGQR